MDRRDFFGALVAPAAAALTLGAGSAFAYPNPRRRRFRIRRRIRRHAFTRVIYGRPFWVVPVGLAVGWELSHRNRVVVVRETRIIERDGKKTEVAVVEDASGNKETIDITRENTADNSKNLKGSVVDEGDTATPAVEDDSAD